MAGYVGGDGCDLCICFSSAHHLGEFSGCTTGSRGKSKSYSVFGLVFCLLADIKVGPSRINKGLKTSTVCISCDRCAQSQYNE